jgi:hypothetical protein
MKPVGNMGQGDSDASVPMVASPESIGRPVDARWKGDVATIDTLTDPWRKLERDFQGYAANPLMLGDVVLYPNVGEPVRKAEKAMMLFFVMSSKSKAVPKATLEVLRGDTVLAILPVALDAADAHGTIGQLARLPTDAFPAGDYVLRLDVSAGGERQIRETQVRLTE